MNTHLLTKNYLLIPNFIDIKEAKKFSNDFKKDHKKNNYEGDSQAPNSACVYNYEPHKNLLYEKCDEISRAVGTTVLPTYAYSRIYVKGEELKPHIDRAACELTVSVNFDCDKVWPIYIHDSELNPQRIDLNPGDAAIFLGCFMDHWRDPFEGEFCTQTFLHYVRKNGFAANQEGDLANDPEESRRIVKQLAKEYIELGWIPSEVFKPKTNQITNISDAIIVYDNILSDHHCDQIVEHYSVNGDWVPALTAGDVDHNSDKSISRRSDVITLSNLTEEIDRNFDRLVYLAFNKAYILYRDKFPSLRIENDEGYNILRYSVGGQYIEHVDQGKENNRSISAVICLNDDYEGGELEFFGGKYRLKLKKGSIIVFPSNFLYPHRVCPVTSGCRYTIVTWYV